jgi:uncharacterized protein
MEGRMDRRELDALLGRDRSGALVNALEERARVFANQLAPGAFHTARAEERLSEAVDRAFESAQADGAPHPRPLLVVWPGLARLGDRHAAGALDDLQSGADVVLGPAIDGGLYLLGLRQPAREFLERLEDSLASGDLGTLGLAAASEMGLEIGLLRVERALRTRADVEAALADPLTPENIRRVLNGTS